MAQIDITPIGTTDEVSALPLQSNYVEIVSKYNAHDSAVTDVHGITSPDVILSKQDIDDLIDKYYPIGFLRYCWEGSAEAQGLIDTGRFVELEGQKLGETWSESPYYPVFAVSNLPNLDQCFIVGVTTTPPITTIKANTKTLTHTHTNVHTHQIAAHVHSETHLHYFLLSDEVKCKITYDFSDHDFYVKKDGSGTSSGGYTIYRPGGTDGQVETFTDCITVYGYTDYLTQNTGSKTAFSSDNNTNTTVTDFSSGSVLTSTQDIRPKYAKVKAYLRIL